MLMLLSEISKSPPPRMKLKMLRRRDAGAGGPDPFFIAMALSLILGFHAVSPTECARAQVPRGEDANCPCSHDFLLPRGCIFVGAFFIYF